MMLPKRKRIADRSHMEKVAQLPCVICSAWPVQVHHCIHSRHSQQRASNTETIPPCHQCHDELHRAKRSWAAKHGEDHTYLPRVAEMLRQIEEGTI